MKKRLCIVWLLLFVTAAAVAEPSIQDVENSVHSGRLHEADLMMQQVLLAHPVSAKAHFAYAMVLELEGSYQDAADEANKARQIDPKTNFAYEEDLFNFEQRVSAKLGHPINDDVVWARYGPLVFNQEHGDVYIVQDGNLVASDVEQDVIRVNMRAAKFQIGINGKQLNICLATAPFQEAIFDPSGFSYSCLALSSTGAMARDNDTLLVSRGGDKMGDVQNTALVSGSFRSAPPLPGYSAAFQVDGLSFAEHPELTLDNYKGKLYGYIFVYRDSARHRRDIMPVEFTFE